MAKRKKNEIDIASNKDQIVLYRSQDGGSRLEVRLEKESVWLSLDQIASLFERDKSVISRHLSNIFINKELERFSVVAKKATTASDGKVYQKERSESPITLLSR